MIRNWWTTCVLRWVPYIIIYALIITLVNKRTETAAADAKTLPDLEPGRVVAWWCSPQLKGETRIVVGTHDTDVMLTPAQMKKMFEEE